MWKARADDLRSVGIKYSDIRECPLKPPSPETLAEMSNWAPSSRIAEEPVQSLSHSVSTEPHLQPIRGEVFREDLQ